MIAISTVIIVACVLGLGHCVFMLGYFRCRLDVLEKATGPAIEEVWALIKASDEKVDRIELWKGYEAVVNRFHAIEEPRLPWFRRP